MGPNRPDHLSGCQEAQYGGSNTGTLSPNFSATPTFPALEPPTATARPRSGISGQCDPSPSVLSPRKYTSSKGTGSSPPGPDKPNYTTHSSPGLPKRKCRSCKERLSSPSSCREGQRGEGERITRGRAGGVQGARVESWAGGEEEAAPASAAACGPASPRGRRTCGGSCVRCAPAGCCGRTRGQAGAGAEFLQSLTWLPFRCCSRARQRGARQVAAARRRG